MSSVNNKHITVDQFQDVVTAFASKADERFVQIANYATSEEVENAVDDAFDSASNDD